MLEQEGQRRRVGWTVLATGIVFGLLLEVLRSLAHEDLARIFLTTILAFLISSRAAPLVIRGGKGLVQIPFLGHLIQPKAHAFVALFVFIPIAGILIDAVSNVVINYARTELPIALATQELQAYPLVPYFMADVAVGLVLAVLVYLDLQKEYYASE